MAYKNKDDELAYYREYYKINKEKWIKYKEKQKLTPEYIKKKNERQQKLSLLPESKKKAREYFLRTKDTVAHKERYKKYRYLYRYGILPEEKERMLVLQNNKCMFKNCNEKLTFTSAHLDHNHKTGKIRGLLCQKHNTLLGSAEDSILILQNAIEYLENQK